VEGVHLTRSRQRRTAVLDGFGRLGGRYKWGEKRHVIHIEVARLHKSDTRIYDERVYFQRVLFAGGLALGIWS
jgi:hypothetical protein